METSIAPNQPEPGRDVFEQPLAKDVKSESAQQAEEPITTSKVMETVAPQPPPPPPPPVAAVPGGTSEEQEQKEGDSVHTSDIASDKVGPKGEAEAERDRVMSSLYDTTSNT